MKKHERGTSKRRTDGRKNRSWFVPVSCQHESAERTPNIIIRWGPRSHRRVRSTWTRDPDEARERIWRMLELGHAEMKKRGELS